jgi:putative MATE family efflux protein
MNREHLLGQEKINKALFKLSLPAAVGILVMTLYNVVDTIFVGQVVGALAIGGVAVVLPINMLIASAGMAIGIGGSSIISRNLGAKQPEKARQVFGNLITLIMLIGVVAIGLGNIFAEEILITFGAAGEIMPYAKEYYYIILAGTPLLSFAMMVHSVARAEGNSKVAMVSMIITAVVNIALDALFILVFDMGLKGAAYATLISQVVIALYLLRYFASGQSALSLSTKYWRLDWKIVREAFAIGSSSFARQSASSVMAALINHSLLKYGGETSVAIYGIIYRVMMFTFFPMIGLVQGFLPLAGFSYGAQNFLRVKEVLRYGSKAITIISIISFFVIMFFAEPLVMLFTSDEGLIRSTSQSLRIIGYSLPLIGFQMLGASYFQAIGKSLPALFLTLSRQCIFMIPLMIILPPYLGIDGIFYSFPLADVISFVVTLIALAPSWKKLGQQESVQASLVDKDR